MKKPSLRFAVALLGVSVLLSACGMLKTQHAPDDQAITSSIQAKLFQDPVLKTRDIHVTTQKGVVVLNGVVNSDQEKAEVERLASTAPGVTQVIDQMSVTPTAAAAAAPPPAPPVEPSPVPQRAPERKARRERAPAPARHTEQYEAAPKPAPTETASAAPAPAPDAAPTAPPEETPAPPPAPEEPPPPQPVTLPAGTVITVRTIDPIDSEHSTPGEVFRASVAAPVVVGSSVIIPQGSDARLQLVSSASAGRLKGRSEVQVELVSLSVDGTSHPVRSSVYEKVGASRGKTTAERVGAGAVVGALIGALAGHGKGAAVGAAIGAGAGTGVQAATHGQQVRIPSETKIDFKLKGPLTLTL